MAYERSCRQLHIMGLKSMWSNCGQHIMFKTVYRLRQNSKDDSFLCKYAQTNNAKTVVNAVFCRGIRFIFQKNLTK